MGLRLGIFDHLGWAVAVTASPGHEVVDRRRIELLGPGLPNAPVHHPGHGLGLTDVEELIARVRASAADDVGVTGRVGRRAAGPA